MKSTLFMFVVALASSLASPKKYSDETFHPSSNRYYETNLPSPNVSRIDKEASEKLRFGIPAVTYGNTGGGVQYGPSNPMGYVYSPMKIDIGGIALGALLGLGAILIVPKLASAFGGGHGYRSLEGEMSSISEALTRIDNTLSEHNIDSSTCMQRLICTYVNEARKNMQNGEANTSDELILSLSNNTLFSMMVDGTAIKQAVDVGKQGDIEKCTTMFSRCPLSRENVIKVLASLLPA